MIVRDLDDIAGTEREVVAPTFVSRRLLLADDSVGFSLHDTLLPAGTETEMWYRHHVEAVYCVAGEAELEDLDNATTFTIRPGTLYVLDGHERHVLRVRQDFRAVCVFTPALSGQEVHDDDGTYPLIRDESA
jgi:L-ectoine synthase